MELLTAVVAVGLIDTLWVSGLGGPAVAAVTIATSTEHLALGVILALTTGTTVLVGRREGVSPLTPMIRTAWILWGRCSASWWPCPAYCSANGWPGSSPGTPRP
ncbi:MATE family efflux transporter [Microtetraspora glauca]|uniref:MATE family efflux transporter n=1 Tax=Microtetraspora glauca TaxID=1996 RepID=A0ABV3GFC2_MICGL